MRVPLESLDAARLRLVERLLDEGPGIVVTREEAKCWCEVHSKLRMELSALERVRKILRAAGSTASLSSRGSG